MFGYKNIADSIHPIINMSVVNANPLYPFLIHLADSIKFHKANIENIVICVIVDYLVVLYPIHFLNPVIAYLHPHRIAV